MDGKGIDGKGEGGQDEEISLDRVIQAEAVIDPVFTGTPSLRFPSLDDALHAAVTLKVETLNPIRSFKGRGASYYMHQHPAAHPLVVATAGNFGQGLAYAARQSGTPLTVFAATNANPLKIERMRALGAEVRLQGDDFDSAKAAAQALADDTGAHMVVDGKDAAISEGAGTIGLELLREAPAPDTLIIPLGNGAMLNGIATVVRAQAPSTKIIAVCATGAPAMERSWRSGSVIETDHVETIADGIAVRVPVPEALHAMRPRVDDVVLVDDEAILHAMRLLLAHTGLLSEPAGAVGVAALLADPNRFAGQSVATILCGSNVTDEQFTAWYV